eukprot:snap_masked-scaffold_48-processed-gene-0.18-mRNA-1 protein AED:1.00 eAED:1.00 QI:0/0/0/0/1/1/2/0/162
MIHHSGQRISSSILKYEIINIDEARRKLNLGVSESSKSSLLYESVTIISVEPYLEGKNCAVYKVKAKRTDMLVLVAFFLGFLLVIISVFSLIGMLIYFSFCIYIGYNRTSKKDAKQTAQLIKLLGAYFLNHHKQIQTSDDEMPIADAILVEEFEQTKLIQNA